MKKKQIFSSVSLKLCLLGKKTQGHGCEYNCSLMPSTSINVVSDDCYSHIVLIVYSEMSTFVLKCLTKLIKAVLIFPLHTVFRSEI